MSRRPFIAGNWKMNKGPQDADALARQLKAALADQTAVDVAVAPPFLSIPAVAARLKHTGIQVAGQTLHAATHGAFTGEVAGEWLRQLGCTAPPRRSHRSDAASTGCGNSGQSAAHAARCARSLGVSGNQLRSRRATASRQAPMSSTAAAMASNR